MTDLRTTLRTLADDQPQQPGDRLAGVTRRATRIRRTRAAVSVAAVLAVAAPVGLVLADLRGSSQAQFAHTAVTTWPDRSAAADRGVAEGALASYRQLASNLGENVSTAAPRWLFRGTVTLPDHDDVYLAVFVTQHAGKDVVVTSRTRRSQVDALGVDRDNPEDPTSSPWVSHEVAASSGLTHVGAYLGYQGEQPTTDPTTQVTTVDLRNTLFVLADPASRRLRWTQQPLPFAAAAVTTAVVPGGRLDSADGVFTVDTGPLTGPVSVSLENARGEELGADALSTTATPDLVRPALPDVPAGWTQQLGSAGTTERQADGRWSSPGNVSFASEQRAGRSLAVQARCYGGGSLRFTLEAASGSGALATGPVPCDGQSHEALRHSVPRAGFFIQVSGADRLMALQFLAGTVD